VPDAHGHIPRQPFPVWYNLYSPQVTAGPFVVAKYDAGISGAQGS
jgi:hypothetical protein